MLHSRESTERIRVFVALSLSPDTRRRLVAARDRLGDEERRIKWVSAENLHLTMKFLGEVSPEILKQVNDAVRTAASLSPVASFTVRGLGRFPPRGAPRVIWAGVVERIPALVDLHEKLEDGLGSLGIAREKRGFSPHVTLGRVRSKPRLDKGGAAGWIVRIERFLERDVNSVFGEEVIREVSVIRSHLGPKGPRYEELERFELTG
jgi:2'-5' RNA ligase